MKFLNWKIQLSLALIGLSVALYVLNYLIFRDANYMFRLFLAQLGFLPISVLLVTIIVNQLLAQRAKTAKLAKLNMVIGTFFSEVGTAAAQDDLGLRPQPGRLSARPGGPYQPLVRPRFCRFSQGCWSNASFAIDAPSGRFANLTGFPGAKTGFSPAPAGKPQPAGARLLFQPAAGGLSPVGRTVPAPGPGPTSARRTRNTWPWT